MADTGAKAQAAHALRSLRRSTTLPRQLQPLVDPTAVTCVERPRDPLRNWDDI